MALSSSPGPLLKSVSDDSEPVNLLVLKGVSAQGRGGSKPTGCTPLLCLVVGVAAAPSTAHVRAFASCLSEGGCSLGHVQLSVSALGFSKDKACTACLNWREMFLSLSRRERCAIYPPSFSEAVFCPGWIMGDFSGLGCVIGLSRVLLIEDFATFPS